MIGVARALELLGRRELSAEQLVRDCLEAVAAREPLVKAWETLDAEGALREARRIDGLSERPLLCGVPVGLKDLIDTSEIPTGYGSPLFRGHRPAADAACVRLLREAGAVFLGKTVTTEFALFWPGKTRNPRDPARTPGGSSSGSAAAVSAGMVPFTLGSQTAASVIRPASFCGAIGWKPAYGWCPLAGVHPLAPSLDTLGFFVQDLADVPLVLRALAPGRPAVGRSEPPRRPVYSLCRTEAWDRAEPWARAAVEESAARLARAGAEVRELVLPSGLVDAQLAIMGSEAVTSLGGYSTDGLSPLLRDFLAASRAISAVETAAARALAATARALVSHHLSEVDAVMTLAAPGEAPADPTVTGDPLFSRIWTLLGHPSCSLPLLRGPAGMPLGLQLIAADDQRLLRAASFAWEALGLPTD